MPLTKTECNLTACNFGQLSGRQIVADFSGGQLTTDAGLLLIARLDQHYRMSDRFAAGFEDYRDASRVQYALSELIAQRIYGIVQGYEDLNDRDTPGALEEIQHIIPQIRKRWSQVQIIERGDSAYAREDIMQ